MYITILPHQVRQSPNSYLWQKGCCWQEGSSRM